MTKKLLTILLIVVLAGLVTLGFFYWQTREVPKCGMENCHGLDIKCGPNIPDACTAIYKLGDFCRQFASCEIINGECQLVKSTEFDECKACVDECDKPTELKAFDCELDCRKMFEQIDETATWKTYRNEEYGFEVKYPNGWYEKHYYPGDLVELQNVKDEGVRISIMIKDNPQKLSLNDFLSWCYRDKSTCSLEDITVAGVDAAEIIQSVDFGAGWPCIYIPKEDKIFAISYAKTSSAGDYLPIFNQILSTFKFLD